MPVTATRTSSPSPSGSSMSTTSTPGGAFRTARTIPPRAVPRLLLGRSLRARDIAVDHHGPVHDPPRPRAPGKAIDVATPRCEAPAAQHLEIRSGHERVAVGVEGRVRHNVLRALLLGRRRPGSPEELEDRVATVRGLAPDVEYGVLAEVLDHCGDVRAVGAPRHPADDLLGLPTTIHVCS